VIVASGFVEANQEQDVPAVVAALQSRGFEVSERTREKIVYLYEGESAGAVRGQIDALKDIPGVRSVYLAYFSLEGADEEVMN
jgi:nitrate reductase NapAB chaperone NapD